MWLEFCHGSSFPSVTPVSPFNYDGLKSLARDDGEFLTSKRTELKLDIYRTSFSSVFDQNG